MDARFSELAGDPSRQSAPRRLLRDGGRHESTKVGYRFGPRSLPTTQAAITNAAKKRRAGLPSVRSPWKSRGALGRGTNSLRAAITRAHIIEINEHYVQREEVTAIRRRLDRLNVDRLSTPVLTLEFYEPDYATARSSLHPLPAGSIQARQNATSPDTKRRDSRVDASSVINNALLLSRRFSWIVKPLQRSTDLTNVSFGDQKAATNDFASCRGN